MSFKAKIILTISVLMFLSLSIFSMVSYMDTKKNSIIQIENSLKMASRALTDYIDVWSAGKKKRYGKFCKNIERYSDDG